MIMGDIEHLDTKQYEDLKTEYIRRKMARNNSKGYDESSMSVGGSTRNTERDEEENKGTFGRAMDYIFQEKKVVVPRSEDGIELSSKDLQ